MESMSCAGTGALINIYLKTKAWSSSSCHWAKLKKPLTPGKGENEAEKTTNIEPCCFESFGQPERNKKKEKVTHWRIWLQLMLNLKMLTDYSSCLGGWVQVQTMAELQIQMWVDGVAQNKLWEALNDIDGLTHTVHPTLASHGKPWKQCLVWERGLRVGLNGSV